jgi:two-component sensor histidine kinase
MHLSTNISQQNKDRVNKILEVVMAYAQLDFSKKTDLLGNEDILDAIGSGVNMLGEELRNSTMSLKEKEQMLKEIHHRVKNNLQIVSSLLNLQSENIYDTSLQNLIEASRNRINSMALVHEMLYSSADLKKIEIGDYIQRLAQNVNHSLSKPNSQIRFIFTIKGSYTFGIDQMIPVGLILNEIITNSFKYAFPSNKGIISVGIEWKDNKYFLIVSDDGVGMKPVIRDQKSTLGLQLIEMLSAQLDAQLIINTDKGTSYCIIFS